MTRILRNTLVILFALSSSAYAAAGSGAGEGNFLVALFLGLFALIVLFQLVPATLMVIGFLRGLHGGDRKEAQATL